MKQLIKILALALVGATAISLVACKDDTGEEKIPATGIELDVTIRTMEVGEELLLTATLEPGEATDKAVIWESSDPTVATIDFDGLICTVTALKAGPASITVTTEEGGYEDTCRITVRSPEAVIDSGTAGPLTWTMTDRGVLTVSGTGEMPDYEYIYNYEGGYNTAPWDEHLGSAMKLVVEEGVTSIGNSAFSHNQFMTEILLPNSLAIIKENAFSYSQRLTEITIPDGVKTLEDFVFFDCYALVRVELFEGLETLGYMVFFDCLELAEITIPDTVTSIGNSCFCGCGMLPEIAIPEGITTIGSNMFNTCGSLEKVTLPSTITGIGDSAFASCHSMKELIVYAPTPPAASSLPNGETTTLYVPEGSIQAYKDAPRWGSFATITAIPNS